MRRAFLVTGFNNWGKSSLIFSLFDRMKFYWGWNYSIEGVVASFTVESHSNDDYGIERYLDDIRRRLEHSEDVNSDLFGALCPTTDEFNDSREILSTDIFTTFDEVHLLILKNKWDLHAELRIQAIQDYLQGIPNIRFCIIEEDARAEPAEREDQRRAAAVEYISGVYR